MRHEPALRGRLTELDRVGRTTYAAAAVYAIETWLHDSVDAAVRAARQVREEAPARGASVAAAYPGRRRGGSPS